jgi:hypothetical protein
MAVVTPPVCADCEHFSGFNQHDVCLLLSDWEPVRGSSAVPVAAEWERARRFLGFGKHRCGPEGQHFTERKALTPPVGGSCVVRPTR